MTPSIRPLPRLVPNEPARTLRLLGLVHTGIREVVDQIKPYTDWWDEQNQRAVAADGPLLVAIGDSTAIGIGASAPANSYVGVLERKLIERDGERWRTINLALSGARLADAIERQLPILDQIEPDLVVCCVGSNDLMWTRETATLRRRVLALIGSLPTTAPPTTIVGRLASSSARGALINHELQNAAVERDLIVVNPFREPNPTDAPRLAADRFHPNDLGYELMAKPFARALGLEPAPQPEPPQPPI